MTKRMSLLTISVPAQYEELLLEVMEEWAETKGATVVPPHLMNKTWKCKVITYNGVEFQVGEDFDDTDPENLALLDEALKNAETAEAIEEIEDALISREASEIPDVD